METTYEILNRCLVVRLKGDLDHHQSVEIREKSDRLIDKNQIRNILFDFENTHFMDSAGIGLIMGRYKKVIFSGGKVAVSNIGKEVDRIFTISGLYKIIEKYETTKDALQAL